MIHIFIKKLIIPALWAGMIFGLSGHALGALTFTSVVDSMGRQWSDPFSVAPGIYSAQFNEITTAGYTAASIADVIFMYTDVFGPDALTSNPWWTNYTAAFGLDVSLGREARTTTVELSVPGVHRTTGEFGFFRDLDSSITGAANFTILDSTINLVGDPR